MIEFNGKVMSVPEWAKETGIGRSTIYGRLRRGWSIADALTTPTYEGRMLTYDGRTQNISAWAEEVGIERATLLHRLSNGWSIHEALTLPLSSKGRKRVSPPSGMDAVYRTIEGMMNDMKLHLYKSLAGLIEAQMTTSEAIEEAGKKALAHLEARTRLPPGVVADLTKNAKHRNHPTAQATP